MVTSTVVKNEVLVRPDVAERFVTEVFNVAGMAKSEAAFCARSLVQSNLWGVDSHGLLRTPIYTRRLLSRAMNPRPEIKTLRGGLGLEVLDGDDGPGFLVGRAAMERAIELAGQLYQFHYQRMMEQPSLQLRSFPKNPPSSKYRHMLFEKNYKQLLFVIYYIKLF